MVMKDVKWDTYKMNKLGKSYVDTISIGVFTAISNLCHIIREIPSETIDFTHVPCGRCFAHLILGGSDLQSIQ